MEVKANVQRRRQERLRQLQSGQTLESRGTPYEGQDQMVRQASLPTKELQVPAPLPEAIRKMDELPLYNKGPLEYNHNGDPEAAWKEREKDLLRWYSNGGSGVGAGYIGETNEDSGPYPTDGGNSGPPYRKLLKVKLMLSILLFAAVMGVHYVDTPWTNQAKAMVQNVLTEEMDLSRMAAWYEENFRGTPSLLPAFGSKPESTKVHAPVTPAASRHMAQPVKGTVVQGFQDGKPGIVLETLPDANVAAMEEGRIEYVGEREDTGHTIVIQHKDGYRTVYGWLKPTKWEAGDWVKAGDVIGTVEADSMGGSQLYLNVTKDQVPLDPLEVVDFD